MSGKSASTNGTVESDGETTFQYTARSLVGTYETRHAAVGDLVRHGDWDNDTVVPVTENCTVRAHETPTVGPVHLGNRYWDSRRKFPTTGGIALIKQVSLVRRVNGKDKDVEESWWATDCPVCLSRHEVQGADEESRREVIDAMLECCDIEWIPPTDWIEDCDVCGDSHRERRGCTRVGWRDPFPDPSEHMYDCSECDWDGGGQDLRGSGGLCPQCGTTAVHAYKIEDDGGCDEVR